MSSDGDAPASATFIIDQEDKRLTGQLSNRQGSQQEGLLALWSLGSRKLHEKPSVGDVCRLKVSTYTDILFEQASSTQRWV